MHNPTSPPPKTAPPPPGASHIIKSTTKRSPKSPKKKTKKVVESEEITEGRKMTDITTGHFGSEIPVGGLFIGIASEGNLLSHGGLMFFLFIYLIYAKISAKI